jgi:DNA-binding beta-propeller fold protein YncE
MRTTEHITKTPVAAVGVFAVLRGRLRRQGTGAGGRVFIHAPLAALATAASCAVVLTLGTGAAQALETHPYLSSFNGAMTPEGALSFGPANSAADIATGKVYVSSGSVVDVFSSAGVYESQLTEANGVTPFGGGLTEDGLAVDQSTGAVYVAAELNNEPVVDVFNAAGVYQSQIKAPSFSGPRSIAVDDSTGEVYVAASSPDKIGVFSAAGALLAEWKGAGTPSGSFGHSAVAVAVDQASHDVYVADTEHGVVDELEPTDVYLSQLTQADGVTPYVFSNPAQMSVDASGNVYVTDTLKKVVDEFGASGSFVAQVRGTPSRDFGSVTDAVAGAGGDLYVTGTPSSPSAVDIFGPSIVVQPDVTTLPATGVGVTTVTLNGTVGPDSEGKASCQFDYGTSKALGEVAPCAAEVEGASPVEVHLPVTVKAATTYYYRLQATNKNGTDFGEPTEPAQEFTTAPAVDGVSTGAAQAITAQGAELTGSLSPDGTDASYYFEYGPTTSYGSFSPAPPGTDAGSGGPNCVPPGGPPECSPVAAHTTLSGLMADSTYHFRLVAINVNGTTYGNDEAFTTLGPGLQSTSVSEVTSTSATFDASIDPNNAATSFFFEYGPSEAYRSSSPLKFVGSGSGAVPVSLPVQGLTAGTLYHFRVVAVSEGVHYPGTDHTFTTQAPGEFKLIDGRAWEMVSPAQKEGALIYPLGGEPQGILQAAAQGGAITYRANVPTEPGVVGYSNSMQVLSTRSNSTGWSSKDLPSPHATAIGATAGHEYGEEYRFFSEDLSQAILQPAGPFEPCQNGEGKPQPCFSPAASEQTAFERDLMTGLYTPLVTGCPSPQEEAEGHRCPPAVSAHADVEPGVEFGKRAQGGAATGEPCPPVQYCGPFFAGASPDAEHVVFGSQTQLTSQGGAGLVEWSADAPPSEQLSYLSQLPDNGGAEYRAYFGSHGGSNYAGPGNNARHAISDDGSRVFWTAGNHDLYLRDNATRPQSSLGPNGECLQAANACTIQLGTVPAEFLTASSDGSRVFFGVGGESYADLFECEIIEAPGGPKCNESGQPTELGELPLAGNGSGVIGSSEDGSIVYWVSGNYDLYMDRYSAGKWQPTLIAVLSREDRGDWQRSIWGLTARVSPNGEWLAFSSERSLTGYDNQDVSEEESFVEEPHGNGAPNPPKTKVHHDEEVFEYHAATDTLACASCDPTGARPVGEIVREPLDNGLEAGLVNTVVDPTQYEFWDKIQWLAGDLPGGEAFEGSAARYQPRALTDEGRLFFDSGSALVPKDINGAWDVYEYEPENVPAGGEHPCTPSSTSGSVVFKVSHAFEAEGVKGKEGAGCVGLISSGESGQDSAFLDASANGSEVFLLTTSKLSSQDFDNAYDVYDAHECTTASPCVAPPAAPGPECGTAEACRAAPAPEPGIYGAPASATFNGLGNLIPPPAAAKKVVTKKTVKCKRGFVKGKKGKCVRKKPKKRAKRASRNPRTKS